MKAERGFMLAEPRFGRVTKAEKVVLCPEMTVAEAFETIVASCLRHFRLNVPLVVEQRLPAALHQLRVAMRRLRTALSLFRRAVSDDRFARLRDELRDFADDLGEARNLDVFLQSPLDPALRRRLSGTRDAAYDEVVQALESRHVGTLMSDIADWAEHGRWRESSIARRQIGPFAVRRIDRLWKNVERAGVLRRMSEKERHELRILVKKLRYGLEFVRGFHSGSKRRRSFGRALEDLQECLGLLNDAAVARRMVADEAWTWVRREPSEAEHQLLRHADRALDRLQQLQPYWR
jgi:CHAD domain-containing protein